MTKPQTWGELLRELRKVMDMNYNELSMAISVSRNSLRRIELEGHAPAIETFGRLYGYLLDKGFYEQAGELLARARLEYDIRPEFRQAKRGTYGFAGRRAS